MTKAYEEIVDFIAAGSTPDTVVGFELSPEAKDRVADLLHKEKTAGLSEGESSEMEHFLQAEHILRLAKARARSLCTG